MSSSSCATRTSTSGRRRRNRTATRTASSSRSAASPTRRSSDVIQGKADVFSTSQSETPPSESLLESVLTRNASQVHANPQPATIGFFLNTRVPPFNRLDVRRALNYAVDRSAQCRRSAGPTWRRRPARSCRRTSRATGPTAPTRRALGHKALPSPNLARAHALIAHSGTRGMKSHVLVVARPGWTRPFAVKLLRSLGYRASLRCSRIRRISTSSRTRARTRRSGQRNGSPTTRRPEASSTPCSRALRSSRDGRQREQLRVLQSAHRPDDESCTRGTDDESRCRPPTWERVDRQTVDAAPWVPLATPRVIDVVSKRVGNYQYSPAGLGMLIDQLWVR